MKRRQVLRSILSLPAISALPAAAQQPPPSRTTEETPKLAVTAAEAAAPSAPHFFSHDQFATLRRLAEILVPPVAGKPGAAEAGVAEFLDFLIEQSPEDRQILYRQGLDALESACRRLYRKPFSGVTTVEAGTLLAPLHEPWSFEGPANPLARFLRAANGDVLHATWNSREWLAASSGRRAGGIGAYWYPIE